jgi:hypothetical protein
MNKDVLFADIKEAFPQLDNKEINRFCVKHWSNISAWHRADKKQAVDAVKKEQESPANKPSLEQCLTDEQRAVELTKFLDGKLMDGSLSAAELAQFKDIYGLKAKDRDISINIVDFKDVYPEGANAIEVAASHIKLMIEEANPDAPE